MVLNVEAMSGGLKGGGGGGAVCLGKFTKQPLVSLLTYVSPPAGSQSYCCMAAAPVTMAAATAFSGPFVRGSAESS